VEVCGREVVKSDELNYWISLCTIPLWRCQRRRCREGNTTGYYREGKWEQEWCRDCQGSGHGRFQTARGGQCSKTGLRPLDSCMQSSKMQESQLSQPGIPKSRTLDVQTRLPVRCLGPHLDSSVPRSPSLLNHGLQLLNLLPKDDNILRRLLHLLFDPREHLLHPALQLALPPKLLLHDPPAAAQAVHALSDDNVWRSGAAAAAAARRWGGPTAAVVGAWRRGR
jgi:hypothetical protein